MPKNDTYKGQLLIRRSGLTTVWPWRLVIFSFFIFAITLVTYGALGFGYGPYLERQVSLRDTEISALAKAIPEKDQERFLEFYSQLTSLRSVLDNHVTHTSFLTWLESNTNQNVFYSSLTTNTTRQEVVLEGIADSYETLAQQLQVFSGVREVKSYSVRQSQRTPEGRVQFRVELIFIPDIFNS
jgi:hypothetical protein